MFLGEWGNSFSCFLEQYFKNKLEDLKIRGAYYIITKINTLENVDYELKCN